MAEEKAETANTPTKKSKKRTTAASSRKRQSKTSEGLLSGAHARLKSTVSKIGQAGGKDADAGQAVMAWLQHARLEEEALFTPLRDRDEAQEALAAAEVGHDIANILAANLIRREPSDPHYSAIAKEFRAAVERVMATEGKSRSGLGAIAKSAGIDASALKQSSDGESDAGSEQKEMAEADQIRPPGPRVLRLGSERGNRQEYSTMAGSRMRDERGRFTDEDDDDRGRSSSSRRRDDDDDRSYRSRGRENEGSGWYGDSRGHAEAAHRGWETRHSEGRYQDEDQDYRSGYGRGSRSRYEEDDRRSSSQRGGQYRSSDRMSEDRDRDRGQGGWFGDSEGHSQASRRGWEERRSSSRYEDEDDDRGRRMRSSSRDDDDDRSSRGRGGQGGWFGDSEGHSRAAQRGWEHRQDEDDDRRSSSRRR